VSNTALHWIEPACLAGIYANLAQVIRPDGALVNGDHLHDEPEHAASAGRCRPGPACRASRCCGKRGVVGVVGRVRRDPDVGAVFSSTELRGTAPVTATT
jgi:hypothetical protein